jgi:AcrR family transcriptional regulator
VHVSASIDQAFRRREVARAAFHSIARDGLDGATLRAVADEGGWSVGVVQHYFRNKSQLLVATMDFLAESWASLGVENGSTALQRLRNTLNGIVPGRRNQQAKYWRVWVCFWAQATTDDVLASALEMHEKEWRGRLAATIKAGQADGSIRPDISPDDHAAYVAAVVCGLGVIPAVVPSAPPIDGVVDRLIDELSNEGVSSSPGASR